MFVVAGPIVRADVAGLCERARQLMDRGGIAQVICDVRGVTDPDGTTIDALSRLQLAARRRGCRVVLRDVCPELRTLVALAGLSEVLPMSPAATPPG